MNIVAEMFSCICLPHLDEPATSARMSKETVYLIDGSGYIFRAYYAVRPLSNSAGLPTNALFGFTNMLLSFLKDVQPTHAAIVFDDKSPSFRKDIYPEYKANRSAPPEDLVPQFPYFAQIAEALNLPSFKTPGLEADDIIGSLAMRMQEAGHDVVIMSGDKDFMQLIGDGVGMWDTMKDKRIDDEAVKAKFGVLPAQVIDVMALAGDASDNIPGVPGVGVKTAAKLLKQWGTLEKLLENSDKVPGKMGERLTAHADDARLSKTLVTIKTDAEVPSALEELALTAPSVEKAAPLFHELEFSKLLIGLGPAPIPQVQRDAAYQLVLSEADLQGVAAAIRDCGRCALDTETTSLNVREAALVGIAVATQAGAGWYIPVAHDYDGVPEQLPLTTVQEYLGPVLRDASVRKILQNAKYDLPIFARHGLPVEGLCGDTMLMSYILNPSDKHGLDAMALKHCNHQMVPFSAVMGKGKDARSSFAEVPLEEALAYAAEDADYTLQLADHFMPQVHEAGLLELFEGMEMPLLLVLMRMEAEGVTLDTEHLAKISDELAARLSELETQIYAEAGEEFTINSPKQLSVILFEKMGLPGGKKTKTGYSTNAAVLEKLAGSYELPRLILEYRALAKLKSTYVDALPKMVDASTGRVHTDYSQTIAATGRLSSSDPNLQNIPIRSEDGKRIREAFVACDGHLLLAADYSQIELRILAHMSGEQVLIDAFAAGADVHAQTAAALFGVFQDMITPEQRSVGKTVNFGVIYGQTGYGLAGQLGVSAKEAQSYIDAYHAQYPAVVAYREKILADALESGETRTLYGRRRLHVDLASKNQHVRQHAERMAFNSVIQGTAADVMKLAMLSIDHELRMRVTETKMLMQVHDELVFSVPESERESIGELVVNAMQNVPSPKGPFAVPLTVDASWGKNWAECK